LNLHHTDFYYREPRTKYKALEVYEIPPKSNTQVIVSAPFRRFVEPGTASTKHSMRIDQSQKNEVFSADVYDQNYVNSG